MKPTHTAVKRYPDGTEKLIQVRESEKSWIECGGSGRKYDKGTGTVRSTWHFQYPLIRLETLTAIAKAEGA